MWVRDSATKQTRPDMQVNYLINNISDWYTVLIQGKNNNFRPKNKLTALAIYSMNTCSFQGRESVTSSCVPSGEKRYILYTDTKVLYKREIVRRVKEQYIIDIANTLALMQTANLHYDIFIGSNIS